MEFYNEILCVSGSELIISENNPNGIMPEGTYFSLQHRNQLQVIRRACKGQPALIDLNSLPSKYRDLAATKIGVPKTEATVKPFKDKIIADSKAITFYNGYKLSDGSLLTDRPDGSKRAMEYAANASVLNAIHEVYCLMKQSRAKLGHSIRGFWSNAIIAVNEVRLSKGHTLPSKEVPLKRVYAKYIATGYSSLISGKYCNDNSRKVTSKLENLIMSLYSMPNKPFATQTHALYLLFVTGKLEVLDQKTGELFNLKDFYEDDKPIVVGETTVWNYLNHPANRPIVDKVRMGPHRYNNVHRPHHHRHAPTFSFSKISMDDRDLPRKCDNGKWVKAYYAYDVTSGCVIGRSYSLFKNEELFLDCMRDMFRLIERENFGMPMEVEVENHLVNKFFDDLGNMFPFVRICAPGNSQEKRAEHFNRAKKYGVEMKTQNGIGRWWSKHEAYTVDRDRKGDEFVEKNQLPYERLVADDLKACKDYNNQLHPKQKKHPGKTRWQVLVENMNPQAPQVSKAVVYKAIGNKTETSIRRNHYATVMGAKYEIPNFSIMDKLTPGNYSVDAFYLPDEDGMIGEVFMYQANVFICKATKIDTYNESKAEATSIDYENYRKQSITVSKFDAATKNGKQELASAVLIQSEVLKEALEAPVEIVEPIKDVDAPITVSEIDELINSKEFDQDNAEDCL